MYLAMVETCKEVVVFDLTLQWVLNASLFPVTRYCDNTAAEQCATTSGQNKLQNVTEIKRDYVWEYVKENWDNIEWIVTHLLLASIMTKPLIFESHERLRAAILIET